ncbi:MAG: DUF2318 domain-containing protein [Oscillospiraceae bacterium]|nr:DUF2318 domain-containing protein [Oscillospiraceae bacterium]
MLKYFTDTTEALLSMALLTGMLYEYLKYCFHKTGRIFALIGLIGGLLGAGTVTYLKNGTKLLTSAKWNEIILILFFITLCALVLFWIFSALRKLIRPVSDLANSFLLCVIMMITLTYALPNVIIYPYSILLVEKSVLSTAFIFKVIGILFGLILVFLAGLSAGKGLIRLSSSQMMLVLSLALGVNGIRQISMCLRIMLTKKMIQNHKLFGDFSLFKIAAFSSNHDNWFIFGIMIVTILIPVLIWIKSAHVNEPYKTPAEKRKILKKWLINKRWAGLACTCLVLSLLNLTELKVIANREIELSPVEDAPVVNGNVEVSFEQVEDGHLHRFAYTTENDVAIRFIVIKKPNSSSYGIGLDACDICGETGYYEKDGQVVCNLCDVVMNINTIGFKGGCNPIVIPYSIENGKILVPVDGLAEFEKEFK